MNMTTMPLSILEEILFQKKLNEITEENDERQPEKEKELPPEQKVEGVSAQDICETEGARPDNAEKTVQNRKPASQKSVRRTVRKS